MKRWIVALAGIVTVLGPGALYSFSLISTPLTAAFGWSVSGVSWAFAIANVFLAIGALIGGIASDRIGARPIAVTGVILWGAGFGACSTLGTSHSLAAFYLFFGVVGGLGCGLAYISALSAVIKWFPNTKGLGGGLILLGFGIGSTVYNAIIRTLPTFATVNADTQGFVTAQATAAANHLPFNMSRYVMLPADIDRFMALLLNSGIAFIVVGVVAALFVTMPPQAEREEATLLDASASQFTLKMTLGDARFYVLWAMLFLNVFGGVTIISNMVPIMHELTGMSTGDAVGTYAYLAIFNGVGRLLWGWISDRISRRVTFALVLGGQSVAFFILDGTKDPLFILVAISMLLLCYGGGFGIMPALNSDFFGSKHFGANYGAQLSAWGLAAVAGVYFTGIMKGLSGSFTGIMQPVSIMLLVAMLLPLIIETPKKAKSVKVAAPVAA